MVAARFPPAQVSYDPLSAPPGHSMVFYLRQAGEAPLASDEVFVDPYTATILGQRAVYRSGIGGTESSRGCHPLNWAAVVLPLSALCKPSKE